MVLCTEASKISTMEKMVRLRSAFYINIDLALHVKDRGMMIFIVFGTFVAHLFLEIKQIIEVENTIFSLLLEQRLFSLHCSILRFIVTS